MAVSEWQDAVITRGRDTRRRVLSSTHGTRRTHRRLPAPIGNSTHPPEEPTMTAGSTRRTTAAHSRLAAAGAIAVAGALILTGCGDQTKDKNKGGSSAAASSAPLADKLPKEIRDKGVIKVGSDIAYAPVEFKDSAGKVAGIDPDLAAAMGKQLGVTFQFENGTFDALL